MSTKARFWTSAFALGVTACLSGCASSGRTWVEYAPDPRVEATPTQPERSRAQLLLDDADAVEVAPVPRRQVITLGERTEFDDELSPGLEPPREPPASTTIVQVNVAPPQWGYGYAGYGSAGSFGRGRGGERLGRSDGHGRECDDRDDRTARDRSGPPSPPPVAGDWPAPRSHGPAPFSRTLPAKPWR